MKGNVNLENRLNLPRKCDYTDKLIKHKLKGIRLESLIQGVKGVVE